jgi:multimeric flavodoxin WrbA/putative sterol carrier protein
MKVMAVNSSARVGKESKTEIVLDHLVKGMREAGADVDVVNLQKKKINYCIGCFTCWCKTPGRCIHKDDMSKELFPKYVESDLIVMATPLYHYTVNALLKTFIERTLPVAEPFLELRDGVTRHPRRHPQKPVVALSVAGFPEYSVFDELSSYMNYLFKDKLVAEIYRTSSEIMSVMMKEGKVKDSLEATVQGGRELVESMKISDETMKRINQPVSDFESMAPMANLYWQTCIDEKVTPLEFKEKGLTPRPNSIETYAAMMKLGFNKEKAGDARAIIQFLFSGSVQGECYFKIDPGAFDVVKGKADCPDLTIVTPFPVWMDILTGKADGQQMFMEQKYTVEGDVSLLMRMNEFFGE